MLNLLHTQSFQREAHPYMCYCKVVYAWLGKGRAGMAFWLAGLARGTDDKCPVSNLGEAKSTST